MKSTGERPRRIRFSVRRLMILPAAVALAIVVGSWLCPVRRFVTYPEMLLRIRVLDAETHKPIAGARVVIDNLNINEDLGKDSEALTSNSGRVGLRHRFFTLIERQGVPRWTRVYFQGPWLEVSAEGYQASSSPLSDVIGEHAGRFSTNPAEAVVTLRRGRTPGPELSDLIGEYDFRVDGLSNHMQISNNSKYELELWTHSNFQSLKSAGELRLVDGRVRLFHSGSVSADLRRNMQNDLVPIPWADRVYLVAAKDRIKFCGRVNQDVLPWFMRSGPPSGIDARTYVALPGAPSVPLDWKRLLLANSVVGKVTAVVAGPYGRVNLGAQDGVRAGMVLLGGDGIRRTELTVCAVESHDCLVKSRLVLGDAESSPAPPVGTIVRSRRPKDD
jgi:hypothetical protein